MRCAAAMSCSLLQLREVDLGQRLVDQAALVGVGQRLARDLLGGDHREARDLATDLAERLLRRLLDLPRRLLEAPLPVFLDVGAHALALRVGDLAGLGEDALGLALRLADQLAVLLEQGPGLLAGAVGLLDRLRGCGRGARRSASGSGRTRSACSTKKVIANAMIVQIISPGMTSTSGFVGEKVRGHVARPGRSRAGRRGSRRRRQPR